ncbi:MAG: hypothetical protein AAGI68_03260 [Planctomycetota bacterium]
MHVAFLANTAWLDEELAQLHHLVVGLIDESVRVTQVLPSGRAEGEVSAFGRRVSWHEGRRRWRHRGRLMGLKDQLIANDDIDVVHALDGRLWLIGADLVDALGGVGVYTANSGADVALASRLMRKVDPSRAAIVATSGPIAEAIRDAVDGRLPVEVGPPGVHHARSKDTAGPTEEAPAEDRPFCAVVTGDGRLDPHYDAFLAGAAEFVKQHPETQLFCDGMGSDQHAVWRAARDAGLLSNLSLIPRRLGHRELLLRADVLIQPQPLGRCRSLHLQAFAAGVPLLAAPDPMLDHLIPDTTARLVNAPLGYVTKPHRRRRSTKPSSPVTTDAAAGSALAHGWQDALDWAHNQHDARQALGRSARDWAKEHRVAADQVDQLIRLYRTLTGQSIPFPGAA